MPHAHIIADPGINIPFTQLDHAAWNGFTATALAPDTLADLGDGACFNDARVQVESLANA